VAAQEQVRATKTPESGGGAGRWEQIGGGIMRRRDAEMAKLAGRRTAVRSRALWSTVRRDGRERSSHRRLSQLEQGPGAGARF